MITKAISCLGAVSMMALAACSHESRDAKTPASDTMQSEVDVRVGPTPTNGVTTPGNPDSSARAGAGDYWVLAPPRATTAPDRPPAPKQDPDSATKPPPPVPTAP